MIGDGKVFRAGRLGEAVTSVKSRGISSLDGDLCRAIPLSERVSLGAW